MEKQEASGLTVNGSGCIYHLFKFFFLSLTNPAVLAPIIVILSSS